MSSFAEAYSAKHDMTIEREAAAGQACPHHHLAPIENIHRYLFEMLSFLAAMSFLVVLLAKSYDIGDSVGTIGSKA